MPVVDVKRTYLELRSRDDLTGSDEAPAGESLVELRPCSVEDSLRLYRAVGGAYHWRDRLSQPVDDLQAYLERDDVRVFVARSGGRDDGYFELLRHEGGDIYGVSRRDLSGRAGRERWGRVGRRDAIDEMDDDGR